MRINLKPKYGYHVGKCPACNAPEGIQVLKDGRYSCLDCSVDSVKRPLKPKPKFIYPTETQVSEAEGARMDDEAKERRVILPLEKYLHERYDFKYNIVRAEPEIRPRTAEKFEVLDDFRHNSLFRELLQENLNVRGIDKILYSDFMKRYDPFCDYLNGLPKWDGGTDYIGEIASLCPMVELEADADAGGTAAIWREYFKRWFVSMVAAWINENVVNHTMLILIGSQGTRKTSFFNFLMPPELWQYYHVGAIDKHNKDSLSLLAKTGLINYDDFEQLGRYGIADLKSLITLPKVTFRESYGRRAGSQPHRASFCGSTNEKEFLRDPTGERRFLCFELSDKIQTERGTPEMRAGAYSQAVALYKSGYRYYLTDSDVLQVNRRNKSFAIMTPEEELILKYFTPTAKEDAPKMTATDIQKYIWERNKQSTASSITVGKMMLKNGFEKVKFNKGKTSASQVYAYRVELLEQPTAENSTPPPF